MCPCQGFTYISLLILIAVMSVAVTATLQIGSVVSRRHAEEELLKIGAEFQNAFLSYANSTPAGQSPRPDSLEDLLKDSRYPTPKRHLRKVYADPITGQTIWGLIQNLDGKGIIGVHSMSEAQPIKIGNFDFMFKDFEGKSSYQEWKFLYPPTSH